MKKIIIGINIAGICLLGSASIQAQSTSDFCTELKFLMEASKDTFITIRGPVIAEDEAFLGKEIRYGSKRALPDADSTYILKGMKISHVSLMASDSFHSSELVNKYYDLAEQINTCLGSSYSYEELKDEINQMLIYKVKKNTGRATDMQEPVIYVKLDDSKDTHTLKLEVEEPFFKKKKDARR